MAQYPQGGGHWSVCLQYMFGMSALGVDWRWLEVLRSSGDPATDETRIRIFLKRMHHYGFGSQVAVALVARTSGMDLSAASIRGTSAETLIAWIRDADIVWNLCAALREPLLSQFRKRALLDLDPGHLQISALDHDLGILQHEVFFTVGHGLAGPDTLTPTLGAPWVPFWPLIYLDFWRPDIGPPAGARISSVTQWTWGGELPWRGSLLSTSKRDAYFRYLDLPIRTAQKFELAANIHSLDSTGDRERLLSNGWRLVDPHSVARTPALYRQYIKRCRAEFNCPKPVFRELRTGWFSDRSAAFLASGRPVIAEDTGFSDYIPTGRGLLRFRDADEAIAAIDEIDRDYPAHARAARELSEEYFGSTKTLRFMLDSC